MNWHILVRYGELSLKGGNRKFFERFLRDNLQAALRGLAPCPVQLIWGRILAGPLEDPARALAACTRVFGVVSASQALRVPAERGAIEEAAREVASLWLAAHPGGQRTFKVACRRADKKFPGTSEEIGASIGAGLADAFPVLRARMKDPELLLGIDIREEGAFLYAGRHPGPGGLPVGTQGRALLLLSGGIDSPVAGWLAMKRGLRLHGAYFDSSPYTGPATRGKVEDLARVLAAWGQGMRLHVIPFAAVQEAIKERCAERYHTVLFRRAMLRIAERIAREEGCGALVTGENLGQVASQTLENLALIGEAARLPVLRPLITFDKQETIALAARIGTLELSNLPYPDGCTFFSPRHPVLQGRRRVAEEEEALLPLDELAAAAAAGRELLDIEGGAPRSSGGGR